MVAGKRANNFVTKEHLVNFIGIDELITNKTSYPAINLSVLRFSESHEKNIKREIR